MLLLVTGCNGSVGQRVVLRALRQGHRVRGVDLAPNAELVDPDHGGESGKSGRQGFEYVCMDLRGYEKVLECMRGCDAVVTLAAFPNPVDYVVKVHNTNVVISWNVLRAAAELGISRLCQASSVNVLPLAYADERNRKYEYFPLDEKHLCLPDEPYGLSKVICEAQADTITRRYPFMRIASLRLHWSTPSREYPTRPDPSNRRKDLWGYVQEDASADAFVRSVECDTSNWENAHEVFFIVAPRVAHTAHTSEELWKIFYPSVPLRDNFSFQGDVAFFDCSKARRLLGWEHFDTEE